MRVIWCNSLDDSLFQAYVMNNVKIVINYYLHITSHVSHAITSCTHYTSYSLLNLVHDIVCEFVLAIQDYVFLDFDAKYVFVWVFGGKKVEKLVFGRSGLNSCVFEKLLDLYLCISFMKFVGLSSFCINFFFQNCNCSRFSIDRSYCSTDRSCN